MMGNGDPFSYFLSRTNFSKLLLVKMQEKYFCEGVFWVEQHDTRATIPDKSSVASQLLQGLT